MTTMTTKSELIDQRDEMLANFLYHLLMDDDVKEEITNILDELDDDDRKAVLKRARLTLCGLLDDIAEQIFGERKKPPPVGLGDGLS